MYGPFTSLFMFLYVYIYFLYKSVWIGTTEMTKLGQTIPYVKNEVGRFVDVKVSGQCGIAVEDKLDSWAQSTLDFPIGGHVSVLSDYKETGPENFFYINTVTAVMSLIC